MPLTMTQNSTPMMKINEFPFGPYRCRVVDITFDNSYLTGGEILTATQLGWNTVIGAFPLSGVDNAARTLSYLPIVTASADKKQLTFQLFAGAAAGAAHPETASAVDVSAYSGTFMILGT